MKTIGLIGGMSWESTTEYYRIINQRTKEQLGSLNSAKIVLYSVNFEEIADLQRKGDWEAAGNRLADAARALEAAGAHCVVVCTNTMHIVADKIQSATKLPLLHIVDAVGAAIKKHGTKKLGLLGTRFTMEQPFLKSLLQERYGVEIVIPNTEHRAEIHRVIFEELCCGKFLPASRQIYLEAIRDLSKQGAEAVILGCTEIGLLLKDYVGPTPLYDTTELHAELAVRFALGS